MKNKKIICLIVGILICLLLYCLVLRYYEHKKLKSAFFQAVKDNNVDNAAEILEKDNALVNSKNKSIDLGWDLSGTIETPLTIACKNKSPDMINLLLDYGANPNLRGDNYDGDPMELLLSSQIDERYEIAWKMIEGGADCMDGDIIFWAIVIRQDEKNDNSIQIKSVELLDYVLEKDVSINPSEKNGWYRNGTLIGAAIPNNNLEAVRYLISKGLYSVNEDNVNLKGHTALSCAAYYDCYEMCELLISLGANIEQKDSSGKLPVDYALENGNQKLVVLLAP